MRALGPGSVSSFLKIILDVVFFALWFGLAVLGLILLAAVVLSFNPEWMDDLSVRIGDSQMAVADAGLAMAGGLLAMAIYVIGVLVIVDRLRRIFSTLTAGDPFHPDNIVRLRVIGGVLAGLELGRYLFWGVMSWLLPAANSDERGMTLTPWFSVLVVFVLAEIFREGARLRREAELTI